MTLTNDDANQPFDAFISYRQLDPDRIIARQLQVALETYRVPKPLVRRGVRPRLKKVFLDVTELAASTDLGGALAQNLAQSRFLIVVCSPRTPQSKWIAKEVEVFCELGRRDRILFLVIEGTLATSAPLQGFRSTDQQVVSTVAGEGAEPLATTITAPTLSQSLKLLQNEKLRLLAPILGCTFDDLRDRERERKVWRRRKMVAGVGLLLIFFATLTALLIRQSWATRRGALIAISRRLAAQADANKDRQFDLALLLASEAYQRADTFEARSVLLKLLQYHPHLQTILAGHQKTVAEVAFSPDGRLLASASWDHTIQLWDVIQRRPLGPPLAGHKESVSSLVFSGDGKTLISGSYDKTLIFWDVPSGKQRGVPLPANWNHVRSMAMSPDGKLLAASTGPFLIWLWDVETHERIWEFRAHAEIDSIAFSPDGSLLASGGEDSLVTLWDVKRRSQLGSPLKLHSSDVSDVKFSPDGKTLASASWDGTVVLWDVSTRKKIRQMPESVKLGDHPFVNAITFAQAGKRIIAGLSDRTIVIWDTASGETIDEPWRGHRAGVSTLAVSPDGATLASGSEEGELILWGLNQPYAISQPVEFGAPVANLHFCQKEILALNSWDEAAQQYNQITLWDPSKSQPHGPPLHVTDGRAFLFACSPDGKLLATLSADEKEIDVWLTETSQIKQHFVGHSGKVTSLAFSRAGKVLASGGGDQRIQLWNLDTGSPLRPALETASAPLSLAFSADDKIVVSGGRENAASDSRITFWDLSSGAPVNPPLINMGAPTVLAFSNDGEYLVSGHVSDAITGSNPETVVLWTVATHQKNLVLLAHTATITTIEFSSDGQFLATGSSDGKILLWDARTHQLLGPLLRAGRYLSGNLSFSRDGRTLATGQKGKGIILWNLNCDSWAQLAREIANRPFTEAELNMFLVVN